MQVHHCPFVLVVITGSTATSQSIMASYLVFQLYFLRLPRSLGGLRFFYRTADHGLLRPLRPSGQFDRPLGHRVPKIHVNVRGRRVTSQSGFPFGLFTSPPAGWLVQVPSVPTRWFQTRPPVTRGAVKQRRASLSLGCMCILQ